MTQTDLSPVEITTPRIEYTGEPPLAVYCPNCGAYEMTLGFTGEMDCDQCGRTFEVIDRESMRP